VSIDSVRAQGRTLTAVDRVEIPARSGPVTFSFECPSFIDEAANRFHYRLVGLSDQWTTTDPGEHVTTFGGLPRGRYRFEVSAFTSDGRRSAVPATVTLIVSPLWWQRSSARLGALLVIALCCLAGVRWRERRFASEQQRLERLIEDRTEALQQATRRFEELAATDDLTGLANRRSILHALRQMAAFSIRSCDSFAAALIDIDHFKEVNDRFGHESGDRVLKAVAEALHSALREQDRIGRYGGDEFLAIFPGTDARAALLPCERMRTALAERLRDIWLPGCRVTLSVGIAELSVDDSAVESLIRRADEALYQAKHSGRDTIRIARPSVPGRSSRPGDERPGPRRGERISP
jgi:diguanylate cyclase (GGDEF)-like protein